MVTNLTLHVAIPRVLRPGAVPVSPPCAPQPDLVIGTAITYGAVHCAEALGAACHVISTIPLRPTKVRAERVLVRHAAHVRYFSGTAPLCDVPSSFRSDHNVIYSQPVPALGGWHC